MTHHVVQFTNLPDFITDLDAGDTAAVYHQLIEQRTATSDYGLTRWQLTTVIRAIVAGGRINGVPIVHLAAITIPHGPQVQRVNGAILGPPSAAGDEPARWQAASGQHDAIIEHLAQQVGIMTRVSPGILNVPADLPLVYAANPLEEEAPAPPG